MKARRQARGTGHKDKRRGFRNVPMERLRDLRVSGRREGGVKDAAVIPNQDGIRRAIAAQMCPFCERGPFKMLPVHTNKIHGVDKWQLRDMAGYTTRDPLCSEEVRATMSAAWHADNLAKANAANRDNGRRPQRWTTAGIKKNTTTLIEWEVANPTEAQAARRVAAEKAHAPEPQARRSAALRNRYANDPALREKARTRLRARGNVAKALAAAQAAANRRSPPEHGTVNRYNHFKCRCDPCRKAKADDRRRATTKASPSLD